MATEHGAFMEIATETGHNQSDVCLIFRGQLRGFSDARLRELIAALGTDVRVVFEFNERADHSAGRVELVHA